MKEKVEARRLEIETLTAYIGKVTKKRRLTKEDDGDEDNEDDE